MRLYSTNDKNNIVNLKEAVLNAFPRDKGLYMPLVIPKLEESFINNLQSYSFVEIGFQIAHTLIGDEISESELYQIIDRAITFPAPVIKLSDNLSVLELWHGPTMAFKDFGARFMAELMSYFLKKENRDTTILVATSGDTGGAVAAGFYNVPGINVKILFPKGKVSPLQEKQLTTWGKNIEAIEIEGDFDDCQRLVKEAFIDKDLQEKYNFSSANSINIARLIPQSFYYAEAYKQIIPSYKPIVFCVPSGNFGNLTAGLIAYKMGLPIDHFIAATNTNKTVPNYIASGQYSPVPSQATLSNAMDVGNPSNFPRMKALFQGSDERSTWNNLKNIVSGVSINDEKTLSAMTDIYRLYQYKMDPHGAVAYQASIDMTDHNIIILETAHPGKFDGIMQKAHLNDNLPKKLEVFNNKVGSKKLCSQEYQSFKELLL